jgi:UDP-GlcNAc3NAcA epimerase
MSTMHHFESHPIHGEKVQLVGDVMYDAALFYGAKAEQVSDVLGRLDLVPKGYVLATIHRAENTDDPGRLGAIFEGFATSGQAIVLPLHPRTRALEAVWRHAG